MAAITAFNLTSNNMSIGHYEAYGNALVTAYASNPYGYRGYYTDSETGFSYLNARYYDPQTQRFTQEDTYWGDNLQRNLYAYCSGNPVILIWRTSEKPSKIKEKRPQQSVYILI